MYPPIVTGGPIYSYLMVLVSALLMFRGLAMRMEAIERWNPTPSAPAGAAKTLRVTATAPAGTSGRPTASRAK